MEWLCFQELPSLERLWMEGGFSLGIIMIVAGIILLFLRLTSRGKVEGKYKEFALSLPVSLGCVVLGAAVILGMRWQILKNFPPESLSFSQKAWTLGEVKQRLENESNVRVELKGEAASFAVDRKVSGACASDVLETICRLYSDKLQCEHSHPGNFIIGVRP
jgi:hypothetical protein